MLYLIGLGLNIDGISKQGLEEVKKCKKIYLDNYTIDYPYSVDKLGKVVEKKIILANREFLESPEIIKEARKSNIALLVYGSPLFATTHVSLIQEARKSKVKCEIIHNASILDAVAETGLQLYKFGKITNIPKWDEKKSFTPDSFIDVIKDNQKINAHTLILVDIGLDFPEALKYLEKSAKKHKIKIDKVIVCGQLGLKSQKIIYDSIENFKKLKQIKPPYCLIIPSKLHFVEKEVLEVL